MVRRSLRDTLSRLLHPHASSPPLSRRDQEFLERVREIVALHQSESAFTTSDVAAGLGISRMHLNRKLRALTGQSTHQFQSSIKRVRS